MGGYITRNANPLSEMFTFKSIELIASSLRRAVFRGEKDPGARFNMAVAATIGMIGRVNSGGGAVHGLAYPLGTKYHMPHAEAIALLLPYVMEYNVVANLPKFVKIAEAMGEKVGELPERKAAFKAISAIKNLLLDIGIKATLKDKGVVREDFSEFAEIVYEYSIRHVNANPRSMSREDIVQVYGNAWEGRLDSV
jgi:alcohol dehydrogenase class IV